MPDKYNSIQRLAKKKPLEEVWTHFFIYRERLLSKAIKSRLNIVKLTVIIKIVKLLLIWKHSHHCIQLYTVIFDRQFFFNF